jgi:hypothetical protein
VTVQSPMPSITSATFFYTYNQNNSGGWFRVNEFVSEKVIVEARNAADADEFAAETLGMDFSGANDCECCGRRWEPTNNAWYQHEPDSVPSVYGEPLTSNGYYVANNGTLSDDVRLWVLAKSGSSAGSYVRALVLDSAVLGGEEV